MIRVIVEPYRQEPGIDFVVDDDRKYVASRTPGDDDWKMDSNSETYIIGSVRKTDNGMVRPETFSRDLEVGGYVIELFVGKRGGIRIDPRRIASVDTDFKEDLGI